MSLTPAQIKPKSFDSRRNFFFFNPGGCASCLRACLGARLLLQSYQYPNISEFPFSGVNISGIVWRKMPESNARSVEYSMRVMQSIHQPNHPWESCIRQRHVLPKLGHPQKGQVTLHKCTHETQNANTRFNSVTRRKARLLCIKVLTRHTTAIPEKTLRSTRSPTERPGYSV